MTGRDAVIVASAEPYLAALVGCVDTFNRPYDLIGVPRFTRSALQGLDHRLCSAFVVNPAPTWSLKRLHREVTEHSEGAVLAVCFVDEERCIPSPSELATDAMRWLASTPDVFSESPTSWATHYVTRSVPSNTEAPAIVRRFVSAALEEWGRPDYIGHATLAASELVTNSVLHSRRPNLEITLAAAMSERGVHLVVADGATDHLPILRRPTTTSRGGRGLRIVEAVTSHWGVTVTPTQKRVWCEISDYEPHDRNTCGDEQS